MGERGGEGEMDGAAEASVGIVAFVAPSLDGFHGVLKRRFTDFVVREVDEHGRHAELTELSNKDKADGGLDDNGTIANNKHIGDNSHAEKEPCGMAIAAAVASQYQINKINAEEEAKSEGLYEAFVRIAGEEFATEDLKRILLSREEKTTAESSDRKEDVGNINSIDLLPCTDKSTRRCIHGFIRERLPDFSSKTIENGVIRMVKESSGPNKKRNRKRAGIKIDDQGLDKDAAREKKRRISREGEEHENYEQYAKTKKAPFTHFTLGKRNVETQDCMILLSKILRVHPATFSFAGTKDKRGITFQRISAKRISSDHLVKVNSASKMPRGSLIKVGSFENSSNPIKLGQLMGNRFTITLRNIRQLNGDEADNNSPSADGVNVHTKKTLLQTVSSAVHSLVKEGFINYYGMQRFGRGIVRTHIIGAELLRGNWPLAIILVLKSWRCDDEATHIKISLIDVLTDFVELSKTSDGDLEKLDSKGRQLAHDLLQYCNRGGAVSEKCLLHHIKNNGIIKNLKLALLSIPRNLRVLYVHAFQSFAWNMAASHRLKVYGLEVVVGDLVAPRDGIETAVYIVSKDHDISSISILDVVLPLPGYDIIYPEHLTKKVYLDLVEREGLSLPVRKDEDEDIGIQHAEFCLSHWPGTYRHVVCKPKDVVCDIMTYTNENDDLMTTELRMPDEKAQPTRCVRMYQNESGMEQGANGRRLTAETIDCQNQEKIALQVSFTLPSSSYATVAIREVTKLSDDKLREFP